MKRPPDLTDAEWAEYLQCQEEHDDLMVQVADRERQIENGWIDSDDEWEFDYGPLPEPPRPSGEATGLSGRRFEVSAFADALAARLPGAWSARPIGRLPAEVLWDNGHVSWAVEKYGAHHRGASLQGPEGEMLTVIDRPSHPAQFLIATCAPEGFQPHHFHGVAEPHGIAVSNQPARAAAQLTGRLLPRYHQARAAVEQRARAEPTPAEPPAPAPTEPTLTMEWNARGELTLPDSRVPEPLRAVLTLLGFRHDPTERAYSLPARGGDRQAADLHMAARGLAEYGIGLTLPYAYTTADRATPTAASPLRQAAPEPENRAAEPGAPCSHPAAAPPPATRRRPHRP